MKFYAASYPVLHIFFVLKSFFLKLFGRKGVYNYFSQHLNRQQKKPLPTGSGFFI